MSGNGATQIAELEVHKLIEERLREAERNLAAARQLLAGLEEKARHDAGQPPRQWPLAERLKKLCAREFGVPEYELSGRGGQHREAVRARYAVIWLLRKLTDASLPAIGAALGRHHTTVMHGLERADYLRRTDPEYAAKLDAMQQALTAELVGLPPTRASATPPEAA